MNDLVTTSLPASWLTSRLGLDRRELERLRERGELLAARSEDGEWSYPAWQFGPGGKVPAGVRQAVSAATAAGLSEHSLLTLLRRRVGLVGGGRFFDLLFEGRADTVVAAIRTVSTT